MFRYPFLIGSHIALCQCLVSSDLIESILTILSPQALCCARHLVNLLSSMPKLVNRSLSFQEVRELQRTISSRRVREEEQEALATWYEAGHKQAERLMASHQVDENLAVVSTIPNWISVKGLRNGYVMLINALDESPRPVVIVIDYDTSFGGRVTFRSLYAQIRHFLQLPLAASLRLCSWRPWYRYIQALGCIPEHRVLPSRDGNARGLLGTTLCYHAYVSLTDDS